MVNKLRNLRQNDCKSYWNLLNRTCCSKTKKNIIDKVSLECFLDHFKKRNTVNKVDEDEKSDYLDVENISSLNVELNRVISEDEVIHAVKCRT